MSNVTPCKGCEDRYIGCHSSCFKYDDWKKQREETNQRRRDYYDSNRFVKEVQYGGIKKCKKS